MAAKQRFKISGWDIATSNARSGTPFEALINPSTYTIERTARITGDGKCDGRVGEALSFDDLVLDGTGVVATQSVEQQLADLLAVVRFKPSGANMAYPVLELVWGTLYYLGRVTSLTTKYTLFAPDGTPLRARVSMKIEEYVPLTAKATERAAKAVTRRQQEVGAGMRLPELCFAAYSDPGMAAAVARFNGLTSIRNVPAGTSINFPPKA
ncbi:CIS tube protein [Massilia timonae]|uniref:Contractile injection system tube protein N-terminal domain-containing protein n=1 Tax=Massilia timonae TaxID=47229 RepID=A0A1S2NAP6_9BURK|nr:hypothetical protein [Massilia timonae]OIJ42115.1 hypothetical protein LO55_3774 [Massilia timonae]